MIYILVAAAVFLLDYKIKDYIEKNKKEGDTQEILRGRILIRKFHNSGAILNFMEKKPKVVEIFSLSLSLILFLGYLPLLFKKGYILLKLALSFILGGAFSNVYDRITRHYVVDYFSFNTKVDRIRRIIFNLSDIFIFIGSIMLIAAEIFKKEK